MLILIALISILGTIIEQDRTINFIKKIIHKQY